MIFLAFIKRNWQALAIVLIAGIIFIRIEILKSERDNAISTIAEMRQADLKQATEVEILTKQGKRAVDDINKQRVSDIQHIGGQYGKVIQNDKKAINNYRAQLAGLLQKQSSSNNSTLPKDDANRPAENNGNAADFRPIEESAEFYKQAYHGQREYIKTLEQAGAVCATDYNTCKAYVDSEQSRIGVSD